MDKTERYLIRRYDQALAALNRIPKGDVRHIAAASRLVQAKRALDRYKQAKATRDQN